MIALSEIPSWVYKILLVLAAMIWGFSFVVMKDVVAVMPPAWLLGIRFTLAGEGPFLKARLGRGHGASSVRFFSIPGANRRSTAYNAGHQRISYCNVLRRGSVCLVGPYA